ncbi:hypothetical protein C7S15_7157 [Burkholderia cepacia]|nr:hypothetical protein [Burkholderia cepacia]
MLDFGMRPSPASTRCGLSCVATSIRKTVGRLWRKDDRIPNNCLPFRDGSIYSIKHIEGRGVVRRYVVHPLHETRKRC